MSNHRLFTTLLLFISMTLGLQLSAETIVIDNFNDNTISPEWQIEGSTFALSAENQAMRVDYNRTSSSWEWDQFHKIILPQPELSQFQIEFRVKTDVQFQMNVKPVYTDGSSDWLTNSIPVTADYQLFTFGVTSAGQKVLETIYIYFDGGSTAIKSGIIHIDEILIQTTSKAMLTEAVTNGELFLQYATEGSNEGQFTPGSKVVFQSVITGAKVLLSNAQATQEEIDAKLFQVNNANIALESARVRSEKLSGLSLACEQASFETQNLYYNLRQIAKHNTLFGMQDATGYGVGWSGDNFRSDVEDVCGDLPAVCAWSIKDVAYGNGFADLKQRITYIYNLGGINTVEWHMDNPYGGDFYWENNPYPDSNVVRSILPGGVNHISWRNQLDNIALFLRNLKGSKGESIPVIFRPWHEHNGGWFWWGETHCSIEEYVQLWHFTVDYLVNDKNVNNLIFAYSPDRFFTKDKYMQRYPGDDYIDIFGHDNYGDVSSTSGIQTLLSQLRHVVELAEQRNKIPALTETGLERITNATWFTQFMLNPIKADPVAKRIAYQAVWRNANTNHHYAPYPGHTSVPDFMNFYHDDFTTFLSDLPDIYGSALTVNGPLDLGENMIPSGKIQVYPNPAEHNLSISNTTEIAYFQIIDLQGRTLESGILPADSVTGKDVSHLPSGMYLLKISLNNGTATTQKFLIR
ncbi:MAG: T9SS type A sorting domain-containing protein [Lentimicrobium sp.]|nr:T9SS type A sorting domain-containing protein [Lentimicrobium sp.]